MIDRLSDAIRDIIQTRYESIVASFGGNDFTLDVWALFALSLTVYWGFALLYSALDLAKWPKFLYRYKIQDHNEVSIAKLIPVLKQVVINQFLVSLPLAMVGHCIKQMIGYKVPHNIPTLCQFIVEFFAFVILREISFYYSHRILHSSYYLYKYVHKRHHEWKAPIAIAGIYCHPIEHVFSNLLPVVIGPVIMNSHRITQWLWLSYVTLLTLNDHSGYHFPFASSAEFHDYHHLKCTQNYGIYGAMDWFHGTDGKFRNTIASKRDRMLIGLTPIKYLFPDDNKTTNNNRKYIKIS